MNATDALMRLGASTAEAVANALDAICSAQVERGEVAVLPKDETPFAELAEPAVDVSVIMAPVGATFRSELTAPNPNCGF